LDEFSARGRIDHDRVHGRRISPPPNTEEDLEVSILLLQLVDCFEVTIEVGTDVIPRVPGIVDILVGPRIREDDFARVRFHVGERVEDVPETSGKTGLEEGHKKRT